MDKFASRKFLVITIQSFVLLILPLIYKHFQISDTILIAVITTTSALAATYTGVNVLDQKLNGGKDGDAK